MKFKIIGTYRPLDHTVVTYIDAHTPYVAYTIAKKVFKEVFKQGIHYPPVYEIEITIEQLDDKAINEPKDTIGI